MRGLGKTVAAWKGGISQLSLLLFKLCVRYVYLLLLAAMRTCLSRPLWHQFAPPSTGCRAAHTAATTAIKTEASETPSQASQKMPLEGPIDGYHSCIVVGAGLAGLYAAQQLKESYPDVLIVEAQDHVGGRVRQVCSVFCNVTRDLGAQQGPGCGYGDMFATAAAAAGSGG